MKISGIIYDLDDTLISRDEAFYSGFTKNVVLVDSIEVAEMSKLLENTYRSVNISMVNEIKIICQKLKIDVYEKLVDKDKFDFDSFFEIMKSADKKTKWSPEKENLFNELRKNITLKENNKF